MSTPVLDESDRGIDAGRQIGKADGKVADEGAAALGFAGAN